MRNRYFPGIRFEKPDLGALRKKYAVFDMHLHSRYSDGRDAVWAIAARARALGIGIAVTDHNDIRGALEMEQYPDVAAIPGVEITSCEGTHVLVYFYETAHLKKFFDKYIRPFLGPDVMSSTRLPVEEIIHCAKLFPSLAIFAHPYSVAYTGICNFNIDESRRDRLLEAADGVEVINAENIHRWNVKCAEMGMSLGKAITGGSDGHSRRQLGRVVTCAACEPSGPAMLDAVKSGKAFVIGHETNLLRKMAASGAKLNVHAAVYPERLQKNIKYSYRVVSVQSTRIRRQLRLRFYGRRNRIYPFY